MNSTDNSTTGGLLHHVEVDVTSGVSVALGRTVLRGYRTVAGSQAVCAIQEDNTRQEEEEEEEGEVEEEEQQQGWQAVSLGHTEPP